MARALVGYVGGPTQEQMLEQARLRRRVADLEAEVARLRAENDGLIRSLGEQIDRVPDDVLHAPVAH